MYESERMLSPDRTREVVQDRYLDRAEEKEARLLTLQCVVLGPDRPAWMIQDVSEQESHPLAPGLGLIDRDRLLDVLNRDPDPNQKKKASLDQDPDHRVLNQATKMARMTASPNQDQEPSLKVQKIKTV